MAIKNSIYKRLIIALLPMLILLLVGEATVRIKFFLQHQYDIRYLIAPFGKLRITGSKQNRIIIPRIPKDTTIYSPCREENLKKSFNSYGWRGAEFSIAKKPGTYRVLVVGSSTVMSPLNGDKDTWVYQLEQKLKSGLKSDTEIEVINGGVGGYDSKLIRKLLLGKGYRLNPDMILYAIANTDGRMFNFGRAVDNEIIGITNSYLYYIHNFLYYKSILYTYLLEKYSFYKTKRLFDRMDEWPFEQNQVKDNLKHIIDECKSRGIEFIFVAEPVNFPINKSGFDLLDSKQIRSFLRDTFIQSLNYESDRSKNNLSLTMQAMTQRLIVNVIKEVCNNNGCLIIDPRYDIDNALKQGKKLFVDIGHKTCVGELVLAEAVNNALLPILEKRLN